MLDPLSWQNNKTFIFGQLKDLDMYETWSVQTLLNNKEAKFNGIPTDVCIEEILTNFSLKECKVSPLCAEMMLANRYDTGYLLTHRLTMNTWTKLWKFFIVVIT